MTSPGLILPQPLSSTSGWQVNDWIDRSWTSQPASGGIAEIDLDQLPADTRWVLTHMVVGCTSTSTTSLRLYLDQVANNALRDGTDAGNFNVADWAPGLMIPPSRTLIARWSGCSDGAIATLTLQATVLRLT